MSERGGDASGVKDRGAKNGRDVKSVNTNKADTLPIKSQSKSSQNLDHQHNHRTNSTLLLADQRRSFSKKQLGQTRSNSIKADVRRVTTNNKV